MNDDPLVKWEGMSSSGGWNLTRAACEGGSGNYTVAAIKRHKKGLVLIASHNAGHSVSIGTNPGNKVHSNGAPFPWWLTAEVSGLGREQIIEAAWKLPDATFPMEEPDFSLDEIHEAQEMVK